MEKMHYGEALITGLAISGFMFLIGIIVDLAGFQDTLAMSFAMAVISGIAAFLAARYVSVLTLRSALGYGILWAALGIVMNLWVVQDFDFSVMADLRYWLPFAAIFVAPIIFEALSELSRDAQRIRSLR